MTLTSEFRTTAATTFTSGNSVITSSITLMSTNVKVFTILMSTNVAPEPSQTVMPIQSSLGNSRSINVIAAGAGAAGAVVVLLAAGLFFIRRRSRRKRPVKGIMTKERINNGAIILESRSDGVRHNGPQVTEASPLSNRPRPRHKQRHNHPQTEAQPARDNDAHILSPILIHKPIISANEVASPGASPVNSQGIDEQPAQLSEDQPTVAGAGFQQFYREMAMMRREIGELRRLDVPPAYPGSINSSQ
ncbi:hypothetical protein DXG01_011977 [Tephrocybe rancida]|nr:hypothetical protein DXG01_011977 [Tephrocybe rancida]